MIDSYRWSRGAEHMLRFGENAAVQVIIVPPLFEEANRTRHLLVDVMRTLSSHGVATVLPDLPGMGESMLPLHDVEFQDWRTALKACADTMRQSGRPIMTVSLRGGALIDDAAEPDAFWRCAPETGQRLVRDLLRTRLTGGSESDHAETLILAGNKVRQSLIDAIAAATPASLPSVRTVRLETDQAPSDAQIAGAPLWRRSEPGDDPALLSAIVGDVTQWIRTCAAS